ncbi:MAG TPA: GNAT family protein [Solirubrobacteraceae bacterium]|jgi:RimJ/RimL family protein N-acetyltransferase|nr:GNAT family protein [Solirubrobacteraceae bacterium]
MSFESLVLEGAHVRLEPLAPGHVADLAEAGADPEVWRWMPVAAPSGESEMAAIVEALRARAAAGAQFPFAQVDVATGRAVGATSYLDIALEEGRIEIGWTWIGRPWWRTAINSEAKLLLLSHAFDTLGLNRVALKTDIRNERSQAAIERIGGVREGVLRAHMIRPDGSLRDTVYFSILAPEWPRVRARLSARL